MFDHHHDEDAAAATTTAIYTVSSPSNTTSWTCPALPSPVNDANPIFGSVTFHTVSEYICVAFAGVATVIAVLLIFRHAIHLSRPGEQIKIMRITSVIPVFALLSIGNNHLGTSAIYLSPWMDVCDSISLINFYFLVRAYLAEAGIDDIGIKANNFNSVDGYYTSHDPFLEDNRHLPKQPPPASKVSLLAAQYIPVAIFCAVLTDITQAASKYCLNSNSLHFAHLWLVLIRTLSVSAAVVSIWSYTSSNKKYIPEHKVMPKLLAFKLIVFLQVAQGVLFSFAGAHINPSGKVSYVDITVGIPALLLSVEMIISAIAFHFVYPATPYENPSPSRYQVGLFGIVAIFTAFNPYSVVINIVEEF